MGKKIRIGSRDSVLAIKQAEIVMASVKSNNPAISFDHMKIKTTGDKVLDRSLAEIVGDSAGEYNVGKGLFIKELEQALLDGVIDIAVHSYKDMPYEEHKELPIVALSERESPFDVLVLPAGISQFDFKKPVGSCSLRRTIQFNRLYPAVDTEPSRQTKNIRGNVLTRLSKLDSGEYSALILAEAGLNRLGLQNRISRIFTADEMIPSASQGILAVQGRQGEDYSYLSSFHSQKSEIISKAERQFLKTLGSGCTSPVAAYAQMHGNEILMMGMYVCHNGRIETGRISGDTSKAEFMGDSLAKQLKARTEGQ